MEFLANKDLHYNDIIMSVMSSLITSITIVYSTVYSGVDQRKHQSSASLPAQKASNAEDVSYDVSSRRLQIIL